GEQQRVALVRALVNVPKLLLLDEPLGALDLKLRLQLQQELVAIQKRVRTTFVFVTHDQQEALNMSDRVAVMNNARIEQIGTPNEIYEFPKTFFVAGFVGQVNRFDGALSIDEGGRTSVGIDGVGSLCVEPAAELKTPGRRGRLCIRPEKISLFARRPTSMENIVEGVVRVQSYLGTHTQFEVTLKNGHSVSVFQQNNQKLAKRIVQAGDKVFLGWQTQLAQFFPEEVAP
ncbi:MAG: ABC transporter ATP-binding protein, partial [Bdellovibrionia bacterium]